MARKKIAHKKALSKPKQTKIACNFSSGSSDFDMSSSGSDSRPQGQRQVIAHSAQQCQADNLAPVGNYEPPMVVQSFQQNILMPVADISNQFQGQLALLADDNAEQLSTLRHQLECAYQPIIQAITAAHVAFTQLQKDQQATIDSVNSAHQEIANIRAEVHAANAAQAATNANLQAEHLYVHDRIDKLSSELKTATHAADNFSKHMDKTVKSFEGSLKILEQKVINQQNAPTAHNSTASCTDNSAQLHRLAQRLNQLENSFTSGSTSVYSKDEVDQKLAHISEHYEALAAVNNSSRLSPAKQSVTTHEVLPPAPERHWQPAAATIRANQNQVKNQAHWIYVSNAAHPSGRKYLDTQGATWRDFLLSALKASDRALLSQVQEVQNPRDSRFTMAASSRKHRSELIRAFKRANMHSSSTRVLASPSLSQMEKAQKRKVYGSTNRSVWTLIDWGDRVCARHASHQLVIDLSKTIPQATYDRLQASSSGNSLPSPSPPPRPAAVNSTNGQQQVPSNFIPYAPVYIDGLTAPVLMPQAQP